MYRWDCECTNPTLEYDDPTRCFSQSSCGWYSSHLSFSSSLSPSNVTERVSFCASRQQTFISSISYICLVFSIAQLILGLFEGRIDAFCQESNLSATKTVANVRESIHNLDATYDLWICVKCEASLEELCKGVKEVLPMDLVHLIISMSIDQKIRRRKLSHNSKACAHNKHFIP